MVGILWHSLHGIQFMVCVSLLYYDLWPRKVRESLRLTNCPKQVGYEFLSEWEREGEWKIKEMGDMRETLGICSSAHTHTHTQYIYTSSDTCNSNFTTDLACLTISWLREMPSFISLAKGRNSCLFYPRSTLVLHTTPNLPRAGVIHLVVLLKSVFSQSVLRVGATSLYHEWYWILISHVFLPH